MTDKGRNPAWTAAATDSKGNLRSRENQTPGTVIPFPSVNSRDTPSDGEIRSSEQKSMDDVTMTADQPDAIEGHVEVVEEPLEIAEQVTSSPAPTKRKVRKADVADVASVG